MMLLGLLYDHDIHETLVHEYLHPQWYIDLLTYSPEFL